MARLTSVLLFAAAALPYVFATNSNSCGSGEFFFADRSCCLPHGGQPSPPSPPAGTSCPTNGWYWHSDNECCVPSTPQTPSSPPPACESDCFWSSLNLNCKRSPPSTPTPTPVPTTTPTQPSTPATPSSSSDCQNGEFFFQLKSCCLPHGGHPNPPSPPSGTSCPTNGWYWHSDKECCVPSTPQTPSSPPPQCTSGCNWNSGDLKCYPQPPTTTSTPPKPSGYAGHKRHTKSRAITLCPNSMTACPIKGLMDMSGDYECFDTENELTSCGGCASTGAGQDCTAINHAWNVACNAGQCQVYTCAEGFKPSPDGKSCLSL
ncbi:hypothetical protein PHLGIDRAFT_82504 [Phlebiopsis gigantea 11061_1 CR5-6]|uniref:Protein CPL1-like domain-containing protein n=1 Tax=Phlebiopsis gigantea (strain 11061_1 CR5-6) TaxID=745531 RepID=A0A0C3P259_PHLG1|nr:hypothetical protein PHLGIDRAFT_82504 [Phlebiopsis gigantea 11061_1 CR5-6]